MGTNYYLKIKTTIKDFQLINEKMNFQLNGDSMDNGYTKLTNGYVFQNTYYPTLEELQKHFCIIYHIGKDSYGWKFCLASYPALNITSLKDWEFLFAHGTIEDEYDRIITPEKMVDIITNKQPLSNKPLQSRKDLCPKYEVDDVLDSENESYEVVNSYDFW